MHHRADTIGRLRFPRRLKPDSIALFYGAAKAAPFQGGSTLGTCNSNLAALRCYSMRRACIGSRDAALRAGMMAATIAHTTSRITAKMSGFGPQAPTWKSWALSSLATHM